MSDGTENQGQDTPADILELSDEEFMKQGGALSAPPVVATSTEEEETEDERAFREAEEAPLKAEQEAADKAAAAATGDDDEAKAEQAAQEAADKAAAEAAAKADPKAGKAKSAADDQKLDADGKPVNKADAPAPKDGEPAKTTTDSVVKIDFEAEYNRLLAPFKANGRDIKVENVDEALRLMQMGANYNKKMAGMKPHMAILKMLENNSLLDAGKISFLIDLEKRNPEAISKLVKDSGIDPLDISAEKAGSYKPGDHTVGDTEVELDSVLDELKDSPKLDQTLDLVSKQWDVKSKQLIAGQPQLLKVITGHMESGIYDLVANELERQRLFGGLHGLSDLEAYRQVGDAMAKDGKFNHILKPAGQPAQDGQQASAAKVVVDPKPKKADDSKREEQRRAAAPAKAAAPAGKTKADFDPLALSDEDFAKIKPNF